MKTGLYRYTVLKQDGTKEALADSKRKRFREMYRLLHCSMIEVIPEAYYPPAYEQATSIYGDEEARFNEENKRNPHMLVLTGDPKLGEPLEWDVVGDVLIEELLTNTQA